jgi:hypothetical protein
MRNIIPATDATDSGTKAQRAGCPLAPAGEQATEQQEGHRQGEAPHEQGQGERRDVPRNIKQIDGLQCDDHEAADHRYPDRSDSRARVTKISRSTASGIHTPTVRSLRGLTISKKVRNDSRKS